MDSLHTVQSEKREHSSSSTESSETGEQKKVKTDQKKDISVVMERINRFLTDEKKFLKVYSLYEKLIDEAKKDPSLTDADKLAIFGGIKSVVMTCEILFTSSLHESLKHLFSELESSESLFTELEMRWIKTWSSLLFIISSLDSDDAFVVAKIHKEIDKTIQSWGNSADVADEEKLFQGNLQIYIIEILIRLLSAAALEYRLTPVFKSINLLMNHHDCIFEENKPLYDILYSQYKDKKMKRNEKKVLRHFTEEDSKNRVHPMRLQGSNPYLISCVS